MFCSKCGSEISDKSVYCNKCGAKVNNNEITSIADENIEESKIVSNSPKIKIKNVIIGLVVLIAICASAFGGYEYVQAKNFNDLVKAANIKMNAGNYDEAIQLYDKALTYRNDSNVQKKLETAQNYKQFQNVYNNGLKLMNDKKYSEAIQKFGTIKQSASKIYNKAQNKVAECKKNIINSDIEAANSAIKKEDYDSANKYAEDILKVDVNNNDAKQLKDTITVAQERAKEQQKAKSNSIVIKYSIDENGYISESNYPNGSSIQVKLGQTINLVGNISPKSSQRVLGDSTVMQFGSENVIKTIAIGGGDLNIIPNGYDWDKALKYHIIVSN